MRRFAVLLLALAACGTDPKPAEQAQACNGSALLCDRRFDEVVFPTTHNAMAVEDEGFVAFNQHFGLEQQLADGIRGMMLDLHPYEGGVWLCHGKCEWGKRSFDDGLKAIRTFLDAHPNEVLAFEFESYVPAPDVAAAFDRAGLTAMAHAQPKGAPWPTLREMIAKNQRIVAFYEDGHASGEGAPAWYMPLFENSFETPFAAQKPEDLTCDLGRGTAGAPLFTLNHFLTQISGSPELADQVNHDPFLLDRAKACEEKFQQRPNFVAVDFYDVGDLFAAVRALNRL